MDTNKFSSSGLFTRSADVKRPFKMSYEGFAGGGKSFTMAQVVLGIWEAEAKEKIVAMIDTEDSSKFVVELFKKRGLIEGENFFVTYSRSLVDFGNILKLVEAENGILMIDTVTHLYEEMTREYLADKNRNAPILQDHMSLKPHWKELFSTPFVKARCHIFFTGRAAWEYSYETNEETHKKEFFKSGVKMRGDNEIAFEPDVVVLMERVQSIENGVVKVRREATIMKDRSDLTDGKVIPDPTFKDFEPIYRFLCSGGERGEDKSGTSMKSVLQQGSDKDYWDRRRRVEIFTEEIQGLFASYIPGQGPKEKKLKTDIYQLVFNTRSQSALEQFKPETLKAGMEEIEHLLAYLDEQADFLGKMQGSGEAVNLAAWLGEELVRFKESKIEREPGSDDNIDFDVGGVLEKTKDGKDGKSGKDHVTAMEQIFETVGNDLKRAPNRAEMFRLWETYRPMIEQSMSDTQMEVLVKLRDVRLEEIEGKEHKAEPKEKGKKKGQAQLEV